MKVKHISSVKKISIPCKSSEAVEVIYIYTSGLLGLANVNGKTLHIIYSNNFNTFYVSYNIALVKFRNISDGFDYRNSNVQINFLSFAFQTVFNIYMNWCSIMYTTNIYTQ